MRAAASVFDFTHDASRDVIASKQLGRAPSGLLALAVMPPFQFVVCGLALVGVGNIVEHEAPAFAVAQHAAFTPDTFGDENAGDAGRPNHSRGMELNELHVYQIGAGIVGESLTIACVFPAIARDLVRSANATGCEHDCLYAEQQKTSALTFVTKCAGNAVSIFQEGDDRGFHVYLNALVDAVILKRSDHFQPCTV